MNLIQGSYMSNAEFFRLNGTLDVERTEQLLDLDEVDFATAYDHINEAMAQFPKEDVLSEVMKDLAALAKKMRKGDNRDELERIVLALEEVSVGMAADAELGRDELDRASSILYQAC